MRLNAIIDDQAHPFRGGTSVALMQLLEPRTFLAAGQLDLTFAAQGRLTEPDGFEKLLLSPDGHINILSANGVRRFDPDGKPDPKFGTNGFASFDSTFVA